MIIALILVHLIVAASFDASPIYIAITLVGGFSALAAVIGAFVKLFDRREANTRLDVAAARDNSEAALAQVSIFRLALDAARARQAELESSLADARSELTKAMNTHSQDVAELQARTASLEKGLRENIRVTNQLSMKALSNGQTATFAYERWYTLIEDTGIMALQLDFDGKIVFISEKCAELLGYFPAELHDHSLIDLVPMDVRKDYLAASLKLGIEGNSIDVTTALLRKDMTEMKVALGLVRNATSVTITVAAL